MIKKEKEIELLCWNYKGNHPSCRECKIRDYCQDFTKLTQIRARVLARQWRGLLPSNADIDIFLADFYESLCKGINGFDASRRFKPWANRIFGNLLASKGRKSKKEAIRKQVSTVFLNPNPSIKRAFFSNFLAENKDGGEKEKNIKKEIKKMKAIGAIILPSVRIQPDDSLIRNEHTRRMMELKRLLDHYLKENPHGNITLLIKYERLREDLPDEIDPDELQRMLAEKLGISYEAYRQRLTRGRKKLRERLLRDGFGPEDAP